MGSVELVIYFSQILVEVIGSGNIALPLVPRRVGERNVVVDDFHRHRIQTVRTNYIGDAGADESQPSRRIDGLGSGGRKVASAFQRSGNDGAAQKGARCLPQS